MLTIRLATLCLAWSIAAAGFAADDPAVDLHAKLIDIYSFQPHTLDGKQLDEKSAQLDTFWKLVKDDQRKLLPMLRKELSASSNPAFFYYDGSKLLLSLSTNPADRQLALGSIVRADLMDVDHTDYLRTVHGLAAQGFDTREAALHALDFPDFKAYIPVHALTLEQDFALIYMLFPMDESSFVDALVQRLGAEPSIRSQKSLLLALWYAATPESHAAIRQFADRRLGTPEVLGYAQSLLNRRGSSLSLSSIRSLREERRTLMKRPISDEALIEFNSLTSKIVAKM